MAHLKQAVLGEKSTREQGPWVKQLGLFGFPLEENYNKNVEEKEEESSSSEEEPEQEKEEETSSSEEEQEMDDDEPDPWKP